MAVSMIVDMTDWISETVSPIPWSLGGNIRTQSGADTTQKDAIQKEREIVKLRKVCNRLALKWMAALGSFQKPNVSCR
jgi:hypothetical protein